MRLPDFVISELDSMEIPVSRIVRLLSIPSWDEDQTTAFGTYIQNVYTGLERILQYLLVDKGENIPKSSTWHYDLLKLASSRGFIPKQIEPILENLMKYRHRHIHGYGHMLDEAKLRELALPIAETFHFFRRHMENSIF